MEAYRKTVNGYEYTTPPQKQYDFPGIAPRKKTAPRQKVYKKIQVSYVLHPEQRLKRKNAFLNCATILVVFAMLSIVVAGYAQISSANLENMRAQENIDELEAKVEQLKLEIATKCGLKEVADVAGNKLFMGFPKNSQVQSVVFQTPVTGESIKAVQQGSWISEIWDGLIGLLK